MNLPFGEKIRTAVVSILEAIVFYILIVIPTEYLLTEHFSIFPFLSPDVKTFIFIAALTIIFVINFFSMLPRRFSWLFFGVVCILTVLSGFGYKKYLNYYGELQTYPKIYDVSHNWGVQATLISIEGKNFGPTWEPGRVFVDNLEFRVMYWSPFLIVVEQPVPPKFFKGKLYVQDAENRRSNGWRFEIKDPDLLQAVK
jgi:hypothetical protein